METLKLVLTQFNDEVLALSMVLLFLFFVLLLFVWSYNKKKYHQLAHQIPASVIKNYLDSIIQNSASLKSTLFRGGGLDVGEGIPSVLPVSRLSSGSLEVSSEVLNQKNAEISSLQGKIVEKDRTIKDLEAQLSQMQNSQTDKNPQSAQLGELKNQVKEAQEKEKESSQKVVSLTKERDEMVLKLKEYEIIEDDLANLKKFQTENAELKKKIEELSKGQTSNPPPNVPPVVGAVAAQAPVTPQAPPPPRPQVQPVSSVEGMPDLDPVDEKSAEDLLSEFEKMLE